MKRIVNKFLSDKYLKKVISGAGFSFIAKLISVAITFLVQIIIVKLISDEALGYFNSTVSYYNILSILVLFGIDTYILKVVPINIAEEINNYDFYRKIIFNTLILLAFMCVVIFIIFLSREKISFNNSYIKELDIYSGIIVIIGLILFVLNKIHAAFIRAYQKVRFYFFTLLIQQLLMLIILTSFLGFSFFELVKLHVIGAYVLSLLISCIIVAGFFLYIVHSEREFVNTKPYKSNLYKNSLPYFWTSAMAVIISEIDIIMLTYFVDLNEVAYYSVAIRMAALISLGLASLNKFVGPNFSELFVKNEIDQLINLAINITRISAIIVIPIFLLFVIFGEELLVFFYSENFEKSYQVLLVISASQLINSLCGPVGYFLNMANQEVKVSAIATISAIINIIMNLYLIPIYGIIGAAYATFASILFSNLISSYFIYKYFGCVFSFRIFRKIK